MQEYEYGRRLVVWLDKHAFSANPFAVWEADQEGAVLERYYLARSYMVRMLGDPTRPQTSFLLANRGAGKTAAREQIARLCNNESLDKRGLPVRYRSFDTVLEQAGGDPRGVTLRHHVEAILREALRAFCDEVPAAYFSALPPDQGAQLLGLARRYGNPLRQDQLGALIPRAAAAYDWDQFSPVDLLDILARIAQGLHLRDRAYTSIYILIDQVDEAIGGPTAACDMLRSLVTNVAVLSRPGLAFKFFLPREVGVELLAVLGPRRDRFVVESIEWDQRALLTMLEARITYYSNSRLTEMAQLCDTSARSILYKFYRAADNSPRALLRLCNLAVREHVERTDTALLQHQDLNRAIAEYTHERELEKALLPSSFDVPITGAQGVARSADQPRVAPEKTPPGRGLVMDGDHVWVDGQRIVGAFSPLEFELLRALYRANRAVVTSDELIEAVYPSATTTDDAKIRGQNEQNIRQLIARLRKQLEPEAADGKWRFIQTERGRGYWLNPS